MTDREMVQRVTIVVVSLDYASAMAFIGIDVFPFLVNSM